MSLTPDHPAAELQRGLMETTDPLVRSQIHVELGRIARSEGRFEQALRHYREALELDPNCEPARRELSWLDQPPTDESALRRLISRLRS